MHLEVKSTNEVIRNLGGRPERPTTMTLLLQSYFTHILPCMKVLVSGSAITTPVRRTNYVSA